MATIENTRIVTVVTGTSLVTTVSNAAGPQGAIGPEGPSGSADPWLGSSGVLYGMEITANVDNTKIDIAAGKARVLNLDDPEDPIWVEVTLASPLLAVALPDIAIQPATSIFIDRLGAVQLTGQNVAPPESKRWAYLGLAPHPFGVVTNPASNATMITSRGAADGLMRHLGEVNLEGNLLTPNGANMLLDKSTGLVLSISANRAAADPYNPDELTTGELTGVTSYLQSWRPATPGDPFNLSLISEVPEAVIDDGTGTLAVLGNNRWVLHCVRYAPQVAPPIQLILEVGQIEYSNLPDAIAGRADPVKPNPAFTQIPRRAWIAVKKGTTSLESVDVQIIHVPNLDLGNNSVGGELA